MVRSTYIMTKDSDMGGRRSMVAQKQNKKEAE